MMSLMNEAVDTLLRKVDKVSKTGEIVDFHRFLSTQFVCFFFFFTDFRLCRNVNDFPKLRPHKKFSCIFSSTA